jgi:hypothetical protein
VAHSAAGQRFAEAANKRQQENAELVNVPKYDVGDRVLIYKPAVPSGTTKKLAALWKGPYEVIERYNNQVNYRVQLLDRLGRKVNNAKSLMVHVSKMKRYYPPETSHIRSSSNSDHPL